MSMGYRLERTNGRDLWGANIDEGYGLNPHIEVNIGIVDGVRSRHRLFRENIAPNEAAGYARMLRWLADDIESLAKSIEARNKAMAAMRAQRGAA
jgi:hypothetical protein